MTYEQELLSGVLTIASQYRILSHLPIIWFSDNEALKNYLDKPPPTNARQRRWYCFLSQFQLRVQHIPGIKNELCDWLSRHAFEEKVGVDFDAIAREAFVRMDCQLDLGLQCKLLIITDELKFSEEIYKGSEFEELWDTLPPYQSMFTSKRCFTRLRRKCSVKERLRFLHQSWMKCSYGAIK